MVPFIEQKLIFLWYLINFCLKVCAFAVLYKLFFSTPRVTSVFSYIFLY